jgi:hypothetical protein
MRYGIRLTTATLIATASLATLPATVAATDPGTPPRADRRNGVPHIAPPEADLLAELAALDDRVTSPLPARAQTGDGFDYTTAPSVRPSPQARDSSWSAWPPASGAGASSF